MKGKRLTIPLSDEEHALLAGASRGTGITMREIVRRGIQPELVRLAATHNDGAPWEPAEARIGRPPRQAVD